MDRGGSAGGPIGATRARGAARESGIGDTGGFIMGMAATLQRYPIRQGVAMTW